MPRMPHGGTASLEQVEAAFAQFNALNAGPNVPIMLAEPRRLTDFGYMFPNLQADDTKLLPQGQATIDALKKLGELMVDALPSPDGNNPNIPAGYTYLGQFIDHDITLETVSGAFGPLDGVPVMPAAEVLQRVKNLRTATLDLDSVYSSPAPFDGPHKMLIGVVSPEGHHVDDKGPDNDLPRAPRHANPDLDREARIGDARNDENLIVAQLHLAFLKAHNAITDRGHSFDTSQQLLRQLYQWVVIRDFLVKIAGQGVVDKVLAGNRFFDPADAEFFMPLEFAVAAYRFGHSMIRSEYDFNVNFGSAGRQSQGTLDLLFTFTALSGGLGGFDTLPENWVIQWENFVDQTPNPTRKIDTHLVEPLFRLKNVVGGTLGTGAEPVFMKILATRNLLRGYKLRMPTGQAVATAMALVDPGITPLTRAEILSVAETPGREEMRLLLDAGLDNSLADKTPLWFYILAEAEVREQGLKLGPVGATIVAEVLIGLVRRSADSIMDLDTGWNPSQLGQQLGPLVNAEFKLSDFLRLAGVLKL